MFKFQQFRLIFRPFLRDFRCQRFAHRSLSDMEDERKVYKIVLTGGPCGGKTSGQARLATFFENLGYKVYMVPEAATYLLGRNKLDRSRGRAVRCALQTNHGKSDLGKSRGGVKFVELSENDAYKFQANLLKVLLSTEETFFTLAESCPRKCLILCDRGAMDGTAYMKEGMWEKMRKEYGFDNVDLRDKRYDQVIHMQTAANGAEEFYIGIQGNKTRSESSSLAVHVDNSIKQAWVGHPYLDIIDNSTDFDGKINRMISTIADRLGLDIGDRLAKNSIKRKFLVSEIVDENLFPPFEDFDVKHDYMIPSSDGTKARLRKRGQNGIYTYMHTVCHPEITKQEVTIRTPITSRQYGILLSQRESTRAQIVKTRRCFLWQNQYFQMDIYREPDNERCRGLILLETFTTLTGNDLPLPDFLRISKEVTSDRAYSMYNLCKM